MKRAWVIILDGVGVGELPDADAYGDRGSDTLGNLSRKVNGLNLPTMQSLGLGNLHSVKGVEAVSEPGGNFGKMKEISAGKDSTTGHWELGGVIVDTPFPTYPNGFPPDVLQEFKSRTGLDVLGNKAASGTEIIKELGEEHVRTGKPIVYTSADSVFQIAAHEDVITLEKLYELCRISREMLKGRHGVARVIARPFIGNNAADFTRTKYRRDFSLKPTGKTILSKLQEAGIPTTGIGKINDLFAYEGISENVITKTNEEGMAALLDSQIKNKSGFIMANLVDFDMLWGHRNDTRGFKKGLELFDAWLPSFLKGLDGEDMVFFTADHGNDPTTPSTDHSREFVPLLHYGPNCKSGVDIGERQSFADLHATLAEYFSVEKNKYGESFLPLICK